MAITSVNNDFKVKHGLVVNTTATILGTATSVSTSTGALVVSGGVGIGGDVFVGNIFASKRGIVGSYDSTSSNYVGFRAPSNLNTTTVYNFPISYGSNGQYLTTDGTGNLSWVDLGDLSYPPFPTGDYGDGEAYPTNNLFQDAFGVSLIKGFDCMDPPGLFLYADLGTV